MKEYGESPRTKMDEQEWPLLRVEAEGGKSQEWEYQRQRRYNFAKHSSLDSPGQSSVFSASHFNRPRCLLLPKRKYIK